MAKHNFKLIINQKSVQFIFKITIHNPYPAPFESSGDRTALGGMGKEKGEEDRIE